MNQREELEKKTFDYFNNGFCCSEALSKAIIEHFSERPDDYPVKVASGFCGGIGRTHEDTCGALTGGVIAAGYLFGRMEPKRDLSDAGKVISEFRKQFLSAFGSTNCAVILERLGEQEKYIKCKELTAKAAGILADILADYRR